MNALINSLINAVELENIVIIKLQHDIQYVVDLDYLRHHPLLKDARIFRLIMGFEDTGWKKANYSKEKYVEIFKEFRFYFKKFKCLRELLNTGNISGRSQSLINDKLKVLDDLSCTFGGIPVIDNFLLEKPKENKDAEHYNPVKPVVDIKQKYLWSMISTDVSSPTVNSWIWRHSRDGWSIVNIEGSVTRIYYARKEKNV